MGDDDDYMSAAFIDAAHPQVVETKKNAKNAPPKKGPAKVRSFKEREAESLQQGLSAAITQENKGFKMLKMMGYKEGSGLGKDESGNVEAIPLNIKRSRAGLGEEEDKKRKINKMVAKRVKFDETLLSSFKSKMKDKFGLRKIEGQNMDESKGITDNELLPKEPTPEEEKEEKEKGKEKEEEKEKTPDEVLESFLSINEYLREDHCYCFFCGTRYDDAEDLKKNCPGPLEDDHD